ncbi:hypothetical protein GDO86_000424 [Hymenochirus boettgeri]|uniref:XRN2-binding (XTBD) domain-containing protein n=1 Tax=Hymenochirus boettgeri TaxID=247094 RepID=A0A8T2KAZ3_9PIPI|nr:hypothetical protein GDO86_000424 [Hymenochirus boettgeri]
MACEVDEFLEQNPETADWVECVRGECESDKLWRYRREFILRNLTEVCGEDDSLPTPDNNHRGLDRLLAYSMVWANHVFMGCRYPHPVMEKVLMMAENIKVTDAPLHTTRDELVAKVKKRGISSSNEGIVKEPSKKHKSKEDPKSRESYYRIADQMSQQSGTLGVSSGQVPDVIPDDQRTDVNTFFSDTSTNHHYMPVHSVKPDEVRFESSGMQEKKDFSESQNQTSKSSVNAMKPPHRLTAKDTSERQPFFNRLYKTVAWKLVSAGGFSTNLSHAEILNSCIESLKGTLDIAFVPLKDLADLPQNKTSQENIVCELRCKAVYLGMGCGKTKEIAKAVASREAVKLFLKKKVVVRICKRKFNGRDVEDLVLLDEESRPVNLPPSLKNPQELM